MAVDTAFRSEDEFTREGFRRWLEARPPSDINHYELLGGRIVMRPPAGWPHGASGAAICGRLDSFVRLNALGIVLDSSAGFELPTGDTVEPDVSFISAERFAAGPAPEPGEFLQIVPDLVVEILSPSTRRRDLSEKRAIYEGNGVREYWAVDTRARNVTLFRAVGGAFDAGVTVSAGFVDSIVLQGLVIPLAEIFP